MGAFCARRGRFERNLETLESTQLRAASGAGVSARQLVRQPEVSLEELFETGHVPLEIDDSMSAVDLASVETTVKYDGYLRRQAAEIERAKRDERRRIPGDLVFDRVAGLSREVTERLAQVRPDTLAHALRIPGVTPAAIAVLSAYVGRIQRPST